MPAAQKNREVFDTKLEEVGRGDRKVRRFEERINTAHWRAENEAMIFIKNKLFL